MLGRRTFIKTTAWAASAVLLGRSPMLQAQSKKIRVGVMLPFTGTFAALGNAINNAFKLAVVEHGGKLSGLEPEYFVVDDESDPAKAPENATRLIKRDRVDVLVGSVHSGVLMGMVKVARENNTLLLIPNAGADEATGPLCAPHIFRTSFSNWQPGYATGKAMADRKHKSAVTLAWKYAAGEQSVNGFKDAFVKGGGRVIKELWIPFPNVEFQPLLTEIAALKPDAVFVFFAGGGAVKLVKDYDAAGLRKTIPLYGSGFLTEGVLEAQGAAAEGLLTCLHYADGLSSPRNNAFRLAYAKTYNTKADVYAVQGYDTALLLAAGLEAVKGDLSKRAELIKAMENAKIDSPRGVWTMSKAHNPIQDFYLRQAVKGENKLLGVAIKGLADPARGCRLN